MTELRVGLGFDVHPRDGARRLLLGGLAFEGEPGLAGHSDGDVVCHAVADALLGAAALGDIGEHFPDTEPSVAGIAGADLLARTAVVLGGAGWAPAQCDVVVLAERPHLAPRRLEMRQRLASILGIGDDAVSVKGSRPEGLGLTGDGIGCLAVATVRPR
jgi:2-C-methyl-D-erythritol 2,4-cyclodiphosphate synthase